MDFRDQARYTAYKHAEDRVTIVFMLWNSVLSLLFFYNFVLSSESLDDKKLNNLSTRGNVHDVQVTFILSLDAVGRDHQGFFCCFLSQNVFQTNQSDSNFL